MPDRDLENRRVGQRVDPATNILYTIDVWNPDRPDTKPSQDGEGEEEEEEEEEDEEAEEGMGEEQVRITVASWSSWRSHLTFPCSVTA